MIFSNSIKEHGIGIERPIRLMFQDEARFGLINTTRRCWAPLGVRPVVGYRIIREYTYAYAAVSPHDGIMDSLVLPCVNMYAMSIFLKEVSNRHKEEFIIMFMDSVSWHKANDLEIPENMLLKFQPPYSPELNPVEHIWDEIREKYFKNEIFKDMDAVEDRMVEGFLDLENNPNKVKSITGFKWIVTTILKAT